MKNPQMTIACAVAALVGGSTVLAAEAPLVPKIEFKATAHPVKPPQPSQRPTPTPPVAAISAPELPTAAIANNGFGTRSAFTASSAPAPDSSTLSPPVTLTYSGGSPVLLVNDSGTNKGVESLITNTKNSSSALFGQTNGSGAGLTGYNSGTAGPAGKFGIINSSSAQAAVTTTTNGTGPALLATVTGGDGQPAILGVNTNYAQQSGIGVQGIGEEYGVEGNGAYGVYGAGTQYGLFGYSEHSTGASGESSDGFGLYANSTKGTGTYTSTASGTGLYAYSQTSTAIYAETESDATGAAVSANNIGTGPAVAAHSGSGYGITSVSETGNGIIGQSTNNHGVIGEDFGSGDGVYGYSSTGYAGYFAGKVGATSYVTLSDRNSKTNFRPIDGKAILDKVSHLPVSSWVFKSDLEKNHVGPMAQDFHAAFGLDGDDDKHINLTDIAGVSLAAIQELSNEMTEKDAQMRDKDREIAELKEQLAVQNQAMAQMRSMTETVAARMTAFEQHQQRLGAATETVNMRKEPGAIGE